MDIAMDMTATAAGAQAHASQPPSSSGAVTWPSAVSGAIPHVGDPAWYFALVAVITVCAFVGWRWLELRAGRAGLMLAGLPSQPSPQGTKCGEHERRLGVLETASAQSLKDLYDKLMEQERDLRAAMREEFAASRAETDRKIDSIRSEFQAMEARIVEAVVRATAKDAGKA